MIAGTELLTDLRAHLAVLADTVGRAVARRRAADANPDDPYRGLYFSDATVDELLDGATPLGGQMRPGELVGPAPAPLLRDLAGAFDLDELDLAILLIAAAPDLDPRFERLYAYLQDDVTRRRATVGLALELAGPGPLSPARARFGPGSRLITSYVLLVEDLERPFLSRTLRLPDRLLAHLVGDDTPDLVVTHAREEPVAVAGSAAGVLARTLAAGATLVYVRQCPGASASSEAAAALRALDRPLLALDLRLVLPGADATELARLAGREARLRGATLVAGPVEAIADPRAPALRALAGGGGQTVLYGGGPWDPAWSPTVPLLARVDPPGPADRARLWRATLGDDARAGFDVTAATAQFRLAPAQVVRAAEAARLQAAAEERAVTVADVCQGARTQNAGGLDRLARRVEPAVDWSDLVLPASVLEPLHEITERGRLGEQVFGEWGLSRPHRPPGAVVALFAGPSGVGKTMAAEVVAGALGLDLYTVDLATVVDKYIGETEKNLERIFVEAEHVNGVVFFDEADALFGKRSEVRDARDRYANVEVAYLLQRLETFGGVAILATNLRSNVDDAFARRLDSVVDFPMPDAAARVRLWERSLGARLPRADDVDLHFLAAAFELSGGNIRNIAEAAAFRAAPSQRPLAMADLIRSTEREYRKLGRLCVEAEFGPWYPLLSPAPASIAPSTEGSKVP